MASKINQRAKMAIEMVIIVSNGVAAESASSRESKWLGSHLA